MQIYAGDSNDSNAYDELLVSQDPCELLVWKIIKGGNHVAHNENIQGQKDCVGISSRIL